MMPTQTDGSASHVRAESLGSCVERLERIDAMMDGAVGPRESLCPGRAEATRLGDLARLLFARRQPDLGLANAFAAALEAIAESQLEHFPETVFWDVDYLAAHLLGLGDETAIGETAGEIVALQEEFGCHSPIRFRYVHDFTDGFDWAKWVRRGGDPSVKPFDLGFLRYLRRRGRELLELIEADDAKYHKLRDERHRNPFSFSREPDEERALHRELARRDQIPLRAWDVDAEPRCDRHFQELRRVCAAEIGVPTRDG